MTALPGRRSVQFTGATTVRAGQLDEDWRVEGVCRTEGHDPEIWFPNNPSQAWLGVALCKTCPVASACLSYAQAHGERNGIWGGVTEWERLGIPDRPSRRLRREELS